MVFRLRMTKLYTFASRSIHRLSLYLSLSFHPLQKNEPLLDLEIFNSFFLFVRQILDVMTEGEKPGGPPRNVNVESISSTEFKVNWDPPDHDLWNGEILGYHVGFKEYR